jgi:hypothetical protein
MTDHKLLHNGTIMKVTVLDAQHFIAEPWRCLTYMTSELFLEMWIQFKWNQWWWKCSRT